MKDTENKSSRREFIRKSVTGAAGISLAAPLVAGNNIRIHGANDRVRVGIIGFSKRSRNSLIPCFLSHNQELNFEIVAVSDLWSLRREEAGEYFNKKGMKVGLARNNEELLEKWDLDAVIIATPDFQHALQCKMAVEAGLDAYVEKPFAESMEDARIALKACQDSGRVVQIGSQRRSGYNYMAAARYIQDRKFGDITMVEMTWNVNQPGRWRRPELVAKLRKEDVDWKRFLMNRPFEEWDPRKYIEYRLFHPYSSGIPGQWMSHQIDTVHWFSGYGQPRSCAANGGVYMWKDGRRNPDTMTAVFDYGPFDDMEKGFQVVYSSRMHNSTGRVKEVYFSNGGTMSLRTNMVTPEGGLTEDYASAMNMEPNLLPEVNLKDLIPPEQQKEMGGVVTAADTAVDRHTLRHMLNWMKCVRKGDPETNAPAVVGYNHSIANMMVSRSIHEKTHARFDPERQEILI